MTAFTVGAAGDAIAVGAAGDAFTVGAAGDGIAQSIEARAVDGGGAGAPGLGRMVCTGVYNGSVAGLVMVPWYRLLDRRLWSALSKVLLHQAIFSVPWTAGFLAWSAATDRLLTAHAGTIAGLDVPGRAVFAECASAAAERLDVHLLQSTLANNLFWGPAQLVNFVWVRPDLRCVRVCSSSVAVSSAPRRTHVGAGFYTLHPLALSGWHFSR